MTTLAAIISSSSRLDARWFAESLARHRNCPPDLASYVVRSSAEATDAARLVATTASIVVAVGGDGTVADVATGMLGSSAVLGIIPAGSTNITARSLGIPSNPKAAMAIVAGPHRRQRVDVGMSDDRCFLHIAGAGVDAEIFRTASHAWKRRFGWLAYLPPAASALRLTPSALVVTADDTVIEARSPLVLIANGGSAISPAFKLHPHIAVDDGWLDLLIFTATTPGQIAATLGRLGSQQLARSPHLIWHRAKRVAIAAEPPLPVELDGDTRGQTPREFTIVPASLEILAPAAISDRSPWPKRSTAAGRF
jgi:diacylglycerol kinase (ATP)